MTDKELKHMSRSDLLELLIAQMEENDKLRQELEEAQRSLRDGKIAMAESRPIAEEGGGAG